MTWGVPLGRRAGLLVGSFLAAGSLVLLALVPHRGDGLPAYPALFGVLTYVLGPVGGSLCVLASLPPKMPSWLAIVIGLISWFVLAGVVYPVAAVNLGAIYP